MPITDLQAIQRIKKPLSKSELDRAAKDNERQRFHALTATSRDDAGSYLATFEKWIEGVLNNAEKFARFKQLMLFPISSSRLIDKAADEYLKAFDAEDKYIDMEFTREGLKVDATEYMETIQYDNFLNKNLFNQCLQASAAVWIVDLSATPNESGYAEPEPLLREVGQLTDIGVTKRGQIEYVIFPLDSIKDEHGKEVEKRWAVIDDECYRVFRKRNGDSEASWLLTNPHQLGYAPTGFIWHDRLIESRPLRIQSPLHALFSDLDKYVAACIFREHVDLYSSFPILWNYKSTCRYESPEGVPCNEGFINYTVEQENPRTGQMEEVVKQYACPACAKRKPIGPGSNYEVPQPRDRESADLSEPAGFINADRQLLDYNAEKIDDMERDLVDALTGDDGTVDQSTTPVNMDQVQARFEKRKGILKYWAEHLQQTDAALRRCLLALRYGPQFLNVSVSYGTEFHLLSPGQAIADYDAARKSGLPTYQLMTRRSRIDKLLAGASESEQIRYYILAQLEPYPDLALTAVPVGTDVWELKANFSQYIARFERENFGVEIFGKALSMATRISTISKTLYTYVQEDSNRRKVPEPAGSGKGRQPEVS
jgi:hypothetical protein